VKTSRLLIISVNLSFSKQICTKLEEKSFSIAYLTTGNYSINKKECGKGYRSLNFSAEKTTHSIKTPALYSGTGKNLFKHLVSTPQSAFTADFYTAF